MTHNTIQQMCTGSELVMGSVYGMRQWFINLPGWSSPRGSLEGHTGASWHPRGQNTAACRVIDRYLDEFVTGIRSGSSVSSPMDFAQDIVTNVRRLFEKYPDSKIINSKHAGAVFHRGNDYLDPAMRYTEGVWRGWGSSGQHSLSVLLPMEEHDIADPVCRCGFYAYTDENSLIRNSITDVDNTVFGIIRAWGHVTEGTKGFRAEHAEIIGMTYPMEGGQGRWWPTSMLDRFPGGNSIVPAEVPRYRNLEEMFMRYEEMKET